MCLFKVLNLEEVEVRTVGIKVQLIQAWDFQHNHQETNQAHQQEVH